MFKCRFNNKHIFPTKKDRGNHEKYVCKDRNVNRVMCKYNPDHIILKSQYDLHLNNMHLEDMKREKEELKIKEQEEKENKNNNSNDLDISWGSDEETHINKIENQKTENYIKNNKELSKYNKDEDAFSEDDIIFKQCYI